MGAHFFTGGLMPSFNLFDSFSEHLKLRDKWFVNGINYEKTSLAWLDNMDQNKEEILEIFSKTYGENQKNIWFNRWRIFFLSCAELFAYEKGRLWHVGHYLFSK